MLRGRRTVRADRRLRVDEKHIRTQSAIWYKKTQAVVVFNHNHIFWTDVLFIRPENMVCARGAQVCTSDVTTVTTP
jgi:hypothetical protein